MYTLIYYNLYAEIIDETAYKHDRSDFGRAWYIYNSIVIA